MFLYHFTGVILPWLTRSCEPNHTVPNQINVGVSTVTARPATVAHHGLWFTDSSYCFIVEGILNLNIIIRFLVWAYHIHSWYEKITSVYRISTSFVFISLMIAGDVQFMAPENNFPSYYEDTSPCHGLRMYDNINASSIYLGHGYVIASHTIL